MSKKRKGRQMLQEQQPVYDEQSSACEAVEGLTPDVAPAPTTTIELVGQATPITDALPDESMLDVADAIDEPIDAEPTESESVEADDEPINPPENDDSFDPEIADAESPRDQATDQDPLSLMQAQIDALAELVKTMASVVVKDGGKSTPRGSGSRPRPDVTYEILRKTPVPTTRPQVMQLQTILMAPDVLAKYKQSDGKVRLTEPQLFEVLEAGKAAGLMRTKQSPVRIFQYYRADLRSSDVVSWK